MPPRKPRKGSGKSRPAARNDQQNLHKMLRWAARARIIVQPIPDNLDDQLKNWTTTRKDRFSWSAIRTYVRHNYSNYDKLLAKIAALNQSKTVRWKARTVLLGRVNLTVDDAIRQWRKLHARSNPHDNG